jgi:hypothetical protein
MLGRFLDALRLPSLLAFQPSTRISIFEFGCGYRPPWEEEIDKVWRNNERKMEMDTRKEQFMADRNDFQMWFGRGGPGKQVRLSKLEAKTDEKQYCVALLAWDTADFATARTIAVWSLWNSEVTVKIPGLEKRDIYAVNWLGKRIYKVMPISATKEAVTFASIRDDDIFCYELTERRQALPRQR